MLKADAGVAANSAALPNAISLSATPAVETSNDSGWALQDTYMQCGRTLEFRELDRLGRGHPFKV